MTLRACSKQSDVAAMLTRGHWPNACPPELRMHMATCRSCTDLVRVTQAFQQSRAAATAQAQLPPPGVLWWRAQLRRRNEALRRVSKPLFGAYVFALAITLLGAVGGIVFQARHGSPWLAWIARAGVESLSPSDLLASGGGLAILIPVFAMVAVAGAVFVYFSAERR